MFKCEEAEGPLCSRCNKYLWTEIEQDTGICGHCADRMYEREMERREFEYYHPRDCPCISCAETRTTK